MHQKILVAALFLLAGVLIPQPGGISLRLLAQGPSVQKKVRKLYEEGQSSFLQRNYIVAAQKFKQALVLEPQSAELLNNLGITYHMEGHPEEAVATLREALRFNPSLLPASLIIGLDLVKLNEPAQAVSAFQNVLAQEPSNRDALLGLASARFALRQFSAAARVYKQEVTFRLKDADAWYGMGICFEHLAEYTSRFMAHQSPRSSYYYQLLGEFLLRQGETIDAEGAFRRALATATTPRDSSRVRATLGFALLGLGDIAGAGDEFNLALELQPGNLTAKMGLASMNFQQGKTKSAIQKLCMLSSADHDFFLTQLGFLADSLNGTAAAAALRSLRSPCSTPGCAKSIDLLRKELKSPGPASENSHAFDASTKRQGRAGSAILAAARIERESGHYTQCTRDLMTKSLSGTRQRLLFAQCSCLSGRFLVALRTARAVLVKRPRNDQALYWEAEAAKRLAQAAFDRAVVLNPNSWQGHILLGDIYRQRKQWPSALSNYQTAAKLEPFSPAPFLGMGTVYWQNGEFGSAETSLRKALRIDPTNLQANFELGDILVRRHQFHDAIPYLERTRSQQPELLAAHADLGKSYAALGETKPAIDELNRALPMDRFGDLHYLLYLQYTKLGQTNLARHALAASQRLRAEESRIQQNRLQQALEDARRKQSNQ